MSFKYIPLLMAPALMFFSIDAMRTGVHTPIAQVFNNTNDAITIQFQSRNERIPTTMTLSPQGKHDLGPAEPLTLLSLVSHGLWKPHNYSGEIRKKLDPSKDILVEVTKPLHGLAYRVEVKPTEIGYRPTGAQHNWIFHIFGPIPDEINKIEPSYFLGTMLGASRDEVRKAYEALRQKWLPQAQAGSKFAQQVMKFVDAAYNAEKTDNPNSKEYADFKTLVANELETSELILE